MQGKVKMRKNLEFTGFLRKWKYLEKKLKKFFIKMDRFLWTKFGDQDRL